VGGGEDMVCREGGAVSKHVDSHGRSHRRCCFVVHPVCWLTGLDLGEGAHEFKGLASMTKPGTIVSRFSVTGDCDWLHVTLFVPSVLSFRLSSRLVASESTSSKDSTCNRAAVAATDTHTATTIRPVVVVAVSPFSS
jgi:hypothetical protein